MKYNYDRKDQVQKYDALPQRQDAKEPGILRRFIKAVLPFLADRWEKGNEYLDEEVESKRLDNELKKEEIKKAKKENFLLDIETEKEMRKIVDLATREDEQAIDVIEVSEEEFQKECEALAEKLELMRLKYGLEISVKMKDAEADKKRYAYSAGRFMEGGTLEVKSTDNPFSVELPGSNLRVFPPTIENPSTEDNPEE